RLTIRRIRQPLPAPLFPYTTLFRSLGAGDILGACALGRQAEAGDPMDRLTRNVKALAGRGERAHARAGLQQALDQKRARFDHVLDRKSTRLNSSHVAISYAVFCVKK